MKQKVELKIDQYLDQKPDQEPFHGQAPIDIIKKLDELKIASGAKSRNQIMVAAFKLFIETFQTPKKGGSNE